MPRRSSRSRSFEARCSSQAGLDGACLQGAEPDRRGQPQGEVQQIAGIAEKLQAGLLKAIALTTINYSTGQTVTWVEGGQIPDWARPLRRSTTTRLTVDHVLASTALPLIFPPVRLADG